MAAAATSRQELPPKTPAQTFPPEAHSPLHRSEERKGEGLPCRLPIGGCTSEATERGWGAEQKGGRNLPKRGVDRGSSSLFSSSLLELRREVREGLFVSDRESAGLSWSFCRLWVETECLPEGRSERSACHSPPRPHRDSGRTARDTRGTSCSVPHAGGTRGCGRQAGRREQGSHPLCFSLGFV